MSREKPMRKVGKNGKAHKDAIAYAFEYYFQRFGIVAGVMASCQYCGECLLRTDADPHHKTPRSELRKAGVKDLDSHKYLMFVHPFCHKEIHGKGRDGYGMGRPTGEAGEWFRVVETSPCNAENGLILERLR